MLKTMKLTCAAALLGAVALAAGCSSNGKEITAESVRADWSPELHSTARSYGQHQNMEARAIDTTGRQFWDDVSSFLLIDKPLRMSPYAIP